MGHKHQHQQQQQQTRSSERRDESVSGSMLAHPIDSLRGLVERLQGLAESPLEAVRGVFEPRFDIEQTGKEIIVSARLPGYEKDGVIVDVTEDSLTIRGSRASEKTSRKHGAATEEVEETAFVRSLTLPAEVRADDAKATFKDGKLEIRLPRAKETRVRRIGVSE